MADELPAVPLELNELHTTALATIRLVEVKLVLVNECAGELPLV